MEPVKGEFTVKFDLTDITKYFRAECEEEVPADQVDQCVNEKVGKFLTLLGNTK